MLPTTKLDGPSELGLLIGPVEYCAPSTSRSVVEEQTIPSLSLKAAPDIVQQYLRNATGFTALATAQRHVRNLYETVLNPARYTIEHNPNLNRAQETRTESDAKSMATQVVPLETDEKTSKPGRRSSKAKEQESTSSSSTSRRFTPSRASRTRIDKSPCILQRRRRQRSTFALKRILRYTICIVGSYSPALKSPYGSMNAMSRFTRTLNR
jgi:hypothetical protein